MAHSTALHATLDGKRYLTGPLARYSLNSAAAVTGRARGGGRGRTGRDCRNPFRSIVVRAVEVVYAIEEALRIIDAYERPARPFIDVPARAGVGHGVSEAPRGLLYHRYEIDDDGLIRAATIVPPTSQNQAAIEHDMAELVAGELNTGRRGIDVTVREVDSQPRPVHLLLGTFPDADGRSPMSPDVVIGIGNNFRRDDGVGLAVAEEVAKRGMPGVRVVTAIAEPSAILDAWSNTRLAVVVDAAMGEGLSPGRIRRWTPGAGGHHGRGELARGRPAGGLRSGRSVGTATRPLGGARRRRR